MFDNKSDSSTGHALNLALKCNIFVITYIKNLRGNEILRN
jgi:hypothetical protein